MAANTAGILNLDIFKGSTFGPVTLTAYSDTAHTIPSILTGWLAHAKVRKASTGPVILNLNPAVTNGPGGVITIPAITDENTALLPRGSYVWDLLLERPTGEVLGPFLAGTCIIQLANARDS